MKATNSRRSWATYARVLPPYVLLPISQVWAAVSWYQIGGIGAGLMGLFLPFVPALALVGRGEYGPLIFLSVGVAWGCLAIPLSLLVQRSRP